MAETAEKQENSESGEALAETASAENEVSEEAEVLLTDDGGASEETDEAELLRELNLASGRNYSAITEFSEHKRYLELMKSGILSAEEAFHAVNRGNTMISERNRADGKGHMSSVKNRSSTGEVFTRADREELAKWGITATGNELERLWREAGRLDG